jgi:nucleotide-binding universal stress UspA family protein
MNNILVPLDFSTTSIDAYRFALDLARLRNSKILVLHVIDLPIDQLKEEAIQKFQQLETTYNTGGIETSLFVELGAVIATIEALIEEHKPEEVVMGTKGASGLKEMVIGSNTEKIIRDASVPVWTIPIYSDVMAIKNIVLPTDLDLNQADFIHKVLSLQKLFSATIHILYVKDHADKSDERETLNELENFRLNYGLSNCTSNFCVAASQRKGILDFVTETNSQLVIMGTHARKGLDHWFLGSLTEEIANQITYPMFTTHLK